MALMGAAVIGAYDTGGRLAVYNKEGKTAAAIAALDDGGTLAIYNKTDNRVIDLYPDVYDLDYLS